MLEQLFIMHPVRFVSKTICEFSKQAGIKTYELDSVNDFSYLINDLKPQIILVHTDCVKHELDTFFKELNNAEFKDFKLALMQETPEDFSERFDYIVDLPFEPQAMLNVLKQSLAPDGKTH